MDASKRKFIAALAAAGAVAVTAGGLGYALFAAPKAELPVCYCSLDQEFAIDQFARFQRERGLSVAVKYDAESMKTVGLANLLLNDRDHPVCDVFWNNEILQTVRLCQQGLFQPYASPAGADLPAYTCDPLHRWHGYAARARCLLIHNPSLPLGAEPSFVSDFTLPDWQGKLALSAPIAGTAASHFAVLRTLWGEDRFKQFCKAIRQNQVRVTAGNSDAAKAAGEGQVAAALTDTDDALGQIAKGKPCRIAFPGQDAERPGRLVIPTTVGLIAGAPHPELGKRLIDAILDRATEQALADGPGGQMPVRPGIRPPQGLEGLDAGTILTVDWDRVAGDYASIQSYLVEQFG